MRVDRLSRHLYDIYFLTKAGVAAKAIADKNLYETIVNHRYKYARVGEVDYNSHHPKTLNPIPPEKVLEEWKADYAKMKEDMIYDEEKPTFETLIENLEDLRKQLKSVSWICELKF
jgi:Zn-dependent oligopeptidase